MAKQTEPLVDSSAAELRDRAKEAGIAGTSHMRKDELVDAIARGGQGAADPDVLALLKADHDTVKALFKEALAKEAGDASVGKLVAQIVTELKLHTDAEETIVYPAIKQRAVDDDAQAAKEVVLEAFVEHGSVKKLIETIRTMSPADESYTAVLTVLSEQIEHHVEQEESEMFEQARKLLRSDELASLGRQVAEMKAETRNSA
jgi:hemerythrin superfamily protein